MDTRCDALGEGIGEGRAADYHADLSDEKQRVFDNGIHTDFSKRALSSPVTRTTIQWQVHRSGRPNPSGTSEHSD
jgi:hypothetical protein